MVQVWDLWNLILRGAKLRPRGPGHLIDKKVLRYACHTASCFLTPLGKPDFVAQECLVKVEPEVGGSGGIRA